MRYPLEERLRHFAVQIILFTKSLPYDVAMKELIRQVVRSAGSIGANYVESNEAVSKKDFMLHLRIARKESRETEFWLSILGDLNNSGEIRVLQDEARQFSRILSAIIKKSE
ncbi:MAG: four helix bundle protein [Bacteroidetes bacterium]|nr:four helix bundle protein [Bacteroidota bacterium]